MQAYYNMNKNKPMPPNLNTINIFYHKRRQTNPALRQSTKIAPQPPYNQLKQNIPDPISPATLQDTDNCDSFNDSNLKYGKSQTLKESTFNRMRIHIYRKQKKTKWLDLLEKSAQRQNQMSHSQPRETNYAKKQEVDRERDNKTSFKRKRLMDYLEKNPKNKTNSSEKEEKPKQQNPSEISNSAFVEPFRQKFQFLQNSKNMYKQQGNQLRRLINENTLRIQFHLKKQLTQIDKRKKRNLSQNIMSIKSKSPQEHKAKRQFNFEIFSKRQEKPRINLQQSREDRFQAWQMGDIMASKHGIVQYINQETQTNEKSHYSVTKNRSQRKNRKRIALKNIKQ